MTGIRRGVEHARAAAIDHGDAVLTTILSGCLRHASCTEGSMHPDMLDAEVGALAYGRLGRLGLCSDHHPVDATGYGPQIVVAGIAFDGVGMRVAQDW